MYKTPAKIVGTKYIQGFKYGYLWPFFYLDYGKMHRHGPQPCHLKKGEGALQTYKRHHSLSKSERHCNINDSTYSSIKLSPQHTNSQVTVRGVVPVRDAGPHIDANMDYQDFFIYLKGPP